MGKKKLYYVPGLVSLIGLPILLWLWGPRDPILRTAATLRLPSDDIKPDPSRMVFSKWRVYHDLRKKKIVAVDLNEYRDLRDGMLNEFRYQKKMDFISEEIARRQFTHDTSSMLKIELGPYCTYGDFVWALNLAKIYDVKRYVFIDDAIYLFTNPRPEPDKVIVIPSPFYNDIVTIPTTSIKEPSSWEIFRERLTSWFEDAVAIVKNSYIYVLGFLLLILTPAISALGKNILLTRKKSAIFRET